MCLQLGLMLVFWMTLRERNKEKFDQKTTEEMSKRSHVALHSLYSRHVDVGEEEVFDENTIEIVPQGNVLHCSRTSSGEWLP